MNFELLLYYYLNIIIVFLFQLIIAEFLFCFRLKKRNNFVLRLIVGAVGVFVIGFVLSIIFYYIGFTIFGRIFVNLLLFGLSFVYLTVCFKEKILTLIFCAIAGYTLQNLAYQICSIFWNYGIQNSWFDSLIISVGIQHIMLAYYICIFPIFIAVCVCFYFLVSKRIAEISVSNINIIRIVVISISTFVVVALLNALNDYYQSESLHLFIISSCFASVCCIFILCYQGGFLDRQKMANELEISERLKALERKQLEVSRETIDLINIKCHDMRHQIRELQMNSSAESNREALREIENTINIYDSKVQSGNETLDVLITEKSLLCVQRKIQLTCMIDGSRLNFISPPDMYALFGNIIENAIEAVSQIEDENKRIIEFTIKNKNDLVFVQVSNYFKGELQFVNGLPVTSKDDVNYHGFGTKSIKAYTKKYRGEVSFSVDDDVFNVAIVFPINK